MYIYKMIFSEIKHFTQSELDLLKKYNLIFETDYGTTEILSENVSNNDDLELEEILRKRLGTDVMEKLFTDEIDIILLV